MAQPNHVQKFLHRVFFISVGIGIFVFLFSVLGMKFNENFITFLFEENHFYEILTCVLLAIKIGVIYSSKKTRPLTKTDYFIIFICLFLIGEEISWGWQFHQFSINEFFFKHNVLEEPNIHNLEISNGLMVEAFLYTFFCLLTFGSLLMKKTRGDKFSILYKCFILSLFSIMYFGAYYRSHFNNSHDVVELLNMHEELIEYSIAYFILFTNFNNFNAPAFSEFHFRGFSLKYGIRTFGDTE